ncbi:MAG: sugar phosphate nucleotidyltransferase, partial [Chitinophagaceae bacterium]
IQQGVTTFIAALGYKHELVKQYLTTQYPGIDISYSIEAEPLGTGGAIALACGLSDVEDLFVVNGDTFFAADLQALETAHKKSGSACTLVLKPMKNFDRYGNVVINENDIVTGFLEKQYTADGLINGGIYALKPSAILQSSLPFSFSFEQDFLAPSIQLGNISGIVQDKYFIDIGIPEDFERAQTELIQNFTPYA